MSEDIVKVDNSVTSTLQPATAADAAKIANAMNASLSLADLGENAELEISDIIVMPGKRESRENPGTYLDCENTYLIAADGSSYFSQSAGIARSAKNLGYMMHVLKGETGSFTVRVITQPTQKGNVKSLMVVRR